ncbi:hypothetical protein [Antarcticirhabdus aurantiaca]|uniref:Uncharacterized protein n=1 Tax=Antarcticirhabdus aurantiaca TaxID=2606717 RepID=A0ACD4NH74_9HYPH|nr:hypothetical protein [Antarcticirhabdus aurantiaca]WAJ26158.1 hypothetical protein OXU80_14685 [Jeongeuplla avenae]
MRALNRGGHVVVALGLLAAAVATAAAQDVPPAPGLRTAMTIEPFSASGPAGDRPLMAGQVLSVTVSFSDAASGRPATGLAPRAFVRRLEPGAPGCGAAAHMLRASGTLSPDDFPLDGRYLVGIARENGRAQLVVTDLAHRLGAANTISVTPIEGAADGFTIGGTVPRAFLLDRTAGRVEAVELPAGGRRLVAEGLRGPGGILAIGDDGLVVAEDATGSIALFDGDGRFQRREHLEPAPFRITASGAGAIVAAADGSAAILRDVESTPFRLPAASLGPAVAADGVALVSAGPDAPELQLRWLDAPADAARLLLPFSPSGLALGEAGNRRYALAWSDGERPELAVVDLTFSRVAARLPLPGPVTASARAGTAFVLAHADPRLVSVLDLAPLGAGAPPFLRRVDIPGPPPMPGGESGILVPLDPEPMALFLPPGSPVAYRIAAGGGISNAMTSTIRVAGRAIGKLALFDRGFAEIAPGRFSALVTLPRGGAYQLVATTGPGGTTGCAGFFVDGPGAEELPPASLRVVSMTPPPAPGGKAVVVLAIRNRPPGLAEGPLPLRLHDLGFGAPKRLLARPGPDQTFVVELARRLGRFSLSVEAPGVEIAPAVFDIRRSTP